MAVKPAPKSTKSTNGGNKGRNNQVGFGPLALFAAVRSPIKYLRRNGFVKGVLGGNNSWTVVAATLWMFRLVGKLFAKNDEVLAKEKLTAGQFVRIESLPLQTRKQKKQSERDAAARAKQAKLDAKQAKVDAKAAKRLANAR